MLTWSHPETGIIQQTCSGGIMNILDEIKEQFSLLFNSSGLSDSLVNKDIGFLGLGRIGLAIAQRLIPFGVNKIMYCNRNPNKEAEQKVLFTIFLLIL